MTNISRKRISAVVVTIGLVSVVGAVFAQSITTNAPATTCVATGGSTVNIRSDGEIENDSSSYVTVVCPVDRPIGTGATTTQLSGTVFTVDRNPTYDVCCQAISKNPAGGTVSSIMECTSGASTSYQQLAIPAITDTATYSHFYITCQIPPASAGAASRIQTVRSIQQ